MADVVTILGNGADFINATSSSIPMVVDEDVWDAGVASDFYGTDGDYSASNLENENGVFTIADGKLLLADTSAIVVGMYCFMDDQKAATTNEVAYYRIDAIDTNVSITLNTAGLTTDVLNEDSTEVNYWIGGVSNGLNGAAQLQNNLDHLGNYAADGTNNVDILCYSSTAVTLAATVDIDNITGSSTTRARLIGTNSDFVDDGTLIEITTTSDIALGLFVFAAASKYITITNFDFNCGDGGVDATNSDYGVYSNGSGNGQFSTFFNCTFRNAILDGAGWVGYDTSFIACKMINNDRYGLSTVGGATVRMSICSSEISNNGSDGINWRPRPGSVSGCIIYGNTGNGISEFSSSISDTKYTNNTIYDNVNGIDINSGSVDFAIHNNTSSGNSGIDFDLNGAVSRALFFGHNNAFGSASPSDQAATDAEFLVLGDGNNITEDPLFTNAGAGNFIPLSTSPLIDAGVGGTGDTIGALCAVAGGGGGVNLLTGLLG
jgi:hypothetical protein